MTMESKYEMLRDECDENDPGRQWKRLSQAIDEDNQKEIPEKRRKETGSEKKYLT